MSPASFDAVYRLGMQRAQQGRLAEAVELLARAVAARPDCAPAHNNLGFALTLLGRPAEALLALERAIAVDPRDPLARNNLGTALQALDRVADAAAQFEQAVALRPDYPEALSNLGAALRTLGRPAAARRMLERAVALKPDFSPARVNLAAVLNAADQPDDAVAQLDRALAIDPRNLAGWCQLGAIRLEQGRLADARACYDRALALDPDHVPALYQIVQSSRVTPGDPALARLEALNPDALTPERRIERGFALAKARADLGRPADGFRALAAANAEQRRRVHYDEAADLGLFARIASVFSADLLSARGGQGAPSDRPVFIVGMMRSGSTLVEQVLASHPDVFAAGERADLNDAYRAVRRGSTVSETYPEAVPLLSAAALRQVGETYLARVGRVAAGRPARRITDKMPGNFSAIGLIRLALPTARIIHTVRDPVDTCLSCYSKLFADPQPFTYDLGELGRYYRAYAGLMRHWRAVLPAEAILDVRYEDLVADFEPQVRRILGYCGLPWNDVCLAFHTTDRAVRTASQAQVRQPLYSTAVGRWRPPAQDLRPLLDGLRDG